MLTLLVWLPFRGWGDIHKWPAWGSLISLVTICKLRSSHHFKDSGAPSICAPVTTPTFLGNLPSQDPQTQHHQVRMHVLPQTQTDPGLYHQTQAPLPKRKFRVNMGPSLFLWIPLIHVLDSGSNLSPGLLQSIYWFQSTIPVSTPILLRQVFNGSFASLFEAV